MDYAILIFLNLLFLGFFYFLFSVRLGKALEKTRKQGIPREFYENVEMVVRYLDTALESVTQKNEAFYRIVSRADELKKELEGLLAEYDKASKRRSKKALTERTMPEEGLRERASERPVPDKHPDDWTPLERPMRPKADDAMRTGPSLRSSKQPYPTSGEDRTVDRLLRDVGEDRIEWSDASQPSDLADLIGAKRDRSSPSATPAEGMFSGVGRFTRRLLGLPELPSLPKRIAHDDGAVAPPTHRADQSDRAGRIDERRQSFEDELMGYSPQQPQAVSPSRPAVAADEYLISEPPQAQSAPSAPSEEPLTSWTSGVTIPDLSNVRERTAFVRSLLHRSVSVEEIAAFTGIAVAEIDFIRKVMESQGTGINRGKRR